jgi:leader peptidase (prepilin peptidase)/N-methyltransferase
MTPLVAACATGGATYAVWQVARTIATRRGLTIGTLPRVILPLAATLAAIAATCSPLALTAIPVLAIVSVAAVVDARTGLIFDPLTLALSGFALLAAGVQGTLDDALIGGAVTGGALFALFVATAGRGMGLGDVKLAAGIGAGFGLARGSTALGLAFTIGGAYGAWLLARRKAAPGSAIRFGPFIAAGTYLALLVPSARP